MDADATFTPLLCPKRFVGCGEFCISENCANETNVEYGAYDELGAYDKHGTYCENDANGEYGAYALHMYNIMKIIQMCKLYILMQVITSPGQVRAGRVRNAKLGVEKLIEEHLPSSLSDYILFETVL